MIEPLTVCFRTPGKCVTWHDVLTTERSEPAKETPKAKVVEPSIMPAQVPECYLGLSGNMADEITLDLSEK